MEPSAHFHPLPQDWAEQRSSLQRIATHVLGQARHRHDGLFDLVPLPGGFGTPPVGAQRERVRNLLGQRAIDEAVVSVPDAQASVGRLWPEHFDFGIDLAARHGVRCNLGAAAGDGFSVEPYLYVGPWGAARLSAADDGAQFEPLAAVVDDEGRAIG